ncbi:MAG: acyltransferase, partial [Rhizobiales bacterium]|nr:acyltransferase [Hyphomicrobiales bacterium]
MTGGRIHEFEALRGALAAWVVIGHVFKHSGYMPDALRPFPLLGDPGMPVDIFIILSGFVIFSLLDHKHEGYWPFITRRFFRLFPLFLVVLLVSAMLVVPALAWREAFPWKTPFLEGVIAINQASADYLAAHFMVHLTMLHGLVPDAILPFSQYGIVGQAWSISVEWQFYLVAPLLFYLLRRRPVALGLVVLGLVGLHSRYWLGEGFALNQGQFFLAGIVSYYLYRNLAASGPQLFLGAATAIALLFWISLRPISLTIWVVALAAAMHAKNGGKNPLSYVSSLAVPQWLGRISYSVYLWHALVIVCLSRLILIAIPGISQSQHSALLMVSTVVGTLGLSAASFRLI